MEVTKRHKAYKVIGKTDKAKRAFKAEGAKILARMKKDCNWSIYTLSIMNWWNLHETGDLTNLLKVKRIINKREQYYINYLYSLLRKEFFNEFGVTDEVRKEHELMLEIIELRNRMVQTEDISLLNDSEEKENELKVLQNRSKNEKVRLLEVATNLKKATQTEFNINTCSVGEFFTLVNMIKK